VHPNVLKSIYEKKEKFENLLSERVEAKEARNIYHKLLRQIEKEIDSISAEEESVDLYNVRDSMYVPPDESDGEKLR
jgi:hypothetical protein